jgi:tetratricopeptide (TPR) repeat protein
MNKAVLSLLFLPLFTIISTAQTLNFGSDSLECRKNYSLMIEYLKQKQYDDAAVFWMKMQEVCPKFSEKYYRFGKDIYRPRIKLEEDKTRKEQLIDTLMLIHQWEMQHFSKTPERTKGKANEYLRLRQSSPELAFELYKELLDGGHATPGSGIYLGYFQSAYLMEIKKKIDKKQFINEYLKIMDQLSKAMENADENGKSQLLKVKLMIDDIFKTRVACEHLYEPLKEIWQNRPTEEPTKTKLAQQLLLLLNQFECTGDALFDEIARYVHQVSPDHSSAYSIGIRAFKNKKYREALTYFEQAIQLCKGCTQSFEYYMMAAKAALNNGQNSKAIKYAKQATKLNSSSGAAYLIIAKAIARSSKNCGDRDLIHRSVYWLAVDYLEKAKNMDSSVREVADKLIKQFENEFPEKDELFFHGLKEGDLFLVPCFGEKTIIRARP